MVKPFPCNACNGVYTQPNNVSVGHYEACQVLKAPPFHSVRANCPRVNFCLSSSAVNPVSCPFSASSLLHMAGGAFRLRCDRSITIISFIDLDSWEPRGDVAALPCQSASVPMPHCVGLRSQSSSSEHLAEQVPGSRQCFASLVPSPSPCKSEFAPTLQCIDLISDRQFSLAACGARSRVAASSWFFCSKSPAAFFRPVIVSRCIAAVYRLTFRY